MREDDLIMPWSETYSVKVSAFDEQHKRLFRLIDELSEAMKVGQGQSRLSSVVTELLRYTETHFSVEEKHLAKINYPDLTAHKAEHQKYIQKIKDTEQELKSGKIGMSVGVLTFLNDWLQNHIKKTDMKYSTYMAANGKLQIPVTY